MVQKLNGRRGENFVMRLTREERSELERMRDETAGPQGLGPWLVWAARCAFSPPPALPRRPRTRADGQGALPELVPRSGIAVSSTRSGNAEQNAGGGIARAAPIILDLCAGTGAWSDPYRLAGYDVRRVTLPE